MSPSEFDLRAALRDGEGDGDDVNIERVIAVGQARRSRRVRVLSSSAAVVLVVGLGFGLAELIPDSSDGSSKSGSAAVSGRSYSEAFGPMQAGPAAGVARTPYAGASSGFSSGGLSAGGDKRAPAIGCPVDAPRYVLPGGGSPGQFGSSDPLFAKSVSSVVVCAYGSPEANLSSTSGATPARLVLTGANSVALVNSVEAASTSRTVLPCPQTAAGRSPQLLALIGITADGTTLTPVTAMLTDPPCNVTVSNGTAVRYQWHPPTNLLNQLLALTPTR